VFEQLDGLPEHVTEHLAPNATACSSVSVRSPTRRRPTSSSVRSSWHDRWDVLARHCEHDAQTMANTFAPTHAVRVIFGDEMPYHRHGSQPAGKPATRRQEVAKGNRMLSACTIASRTPILKRLRPTTMGK